MNDKYIFILEQLAKHKYLTRSLFERVGLNVSRNHFTNLMKALTDKKLNLIGQKKFGYSPTFWKVEDIYYLKQKGKKYLIREHWLPEVDVNLPIGWRIFSSDYFHRIETIRIRIDLEQDLERKGYQILFYDQYFAGKKVEWKRGREAATKIATERGYLKADSIFLIQAPCGKQSLFCLEYHNGHEVKRIEQQMRAHVEAMKIGSPSVKYDLDIWNRVINIFKNEQVMRTLKERMEHDIYFQNMMDRFVFCLKWKFVDYLIINQNFSTSS